MISWLQQITSPMAALLAGGFGIGVALLLLARQRRFNEVEDAAEDEKDEEDDVEEEKEEEEIDPTVVMPRETDIETPIMSRKDLEEKLRHIQSGMEEIDEFDK